MAKQIRNTRKTRRQKIAENPGGPKGKSKYAQKVEARKESTGKVLKKYKEPGAKWHDCTLAECIELTEGAGHWKPGSVLEILESGGKVQTPWAWFKMVKG